MNIHSIKRVFHKKTFELSYYFIDLRGRQYSVSREEFLEVAHSTSFILGNMTVLDNSVVQVYIWPVY